MDLYQEIRNGGPYVDLTYKWIDENGAKQIAQALTDPNTIVQQLWLPNNRIGDLGATALADALKHNFTLQQLYLSNNRIGDLGATALADTLKHNSTLQQLNLSKNTIGDSGATALAEALKHNSTLQRLVLQNNTIGVEGATALLDCFKGASPLQEQWILLSNSRNSLDALFMYNAWKEALEKSLIYNVTLTNLGLFGDNSISEGLRAEIASLLSRENLEQRRHEKALRVALLAG